MTHAAVSKVIQAAQLGAAVLSCLVGPAPPGSVGVLCHVTSLAIPTCVVCLLQAVLTPASLPQRTMLMIDTGDLRGGTKAGEGGGGQKVITQVASQV